MLRSLGHADWQVIRKIQRETKGTKKGTPGAGLRMIPNRRTKDGTFLLDLEEWGLIERAGQDAPPKDALDKVPEPFLIRWRLTELGEYAAEYGEFEDGNTGLKLPTPEEFSRSKGPGVADNTKLKKSALKV